ncbi:hypothetical protein BGZ76_002310 [Entomortierella beljakovae]|nr:hypothetical protein BGZ76_002310 [Entomortierella beljakovae]
MTQVVTYNGDQEDNYAGFGSARPTSNYKSPNRQKWSPLVHTIAEASESFTGTVFPAKLFDDTGDGTGNNGASQPDPNGTKSRVTVEDEEDEDYEEIISIDILLSEIQRLTIHEFGGAFKAVSYPKVLEPLYQRLYDYHVCLKSARKKAGDNLRPKSLANNGSANNSIHNGGSAANSSVALNPTPSNHICHVPSASEEAISKRILALEEKIMDLEKQLAQSRKAHHSLLQDHIMNFTASATISASCIALSRLTLANTTAEISQRDVSAIQNIIASIPNNMIQNSKTTDTEKKILTRSQLSLQDALKTAKENIQAKQFEGNNLPLKDVANPKLSATDRRLNASFAGLPLKDHPTLLNDATTRLLRAETELGLLKLVMAQNQQEISGLEDEVFRKQTELNYHRKVFENILELNQVGLEAQIWEDQVQINDLISQVKKLEEEKEAIVETVKTLESEIRALETRLGEKREERERKEPEMTGRAQSLETTISELREELASKTTRVTEMEEQSLKAKEESRRDQEELETTKAKLQKALESGENDESMVDHLEKEHKKTTMTLRANLVQAQKTNKRLDKELSTLTRKVARIETLNGELSDQAKLDRAEIENLIQNTESLKSRLETEGGDPSISAASSAQTEELNSQLSALQALVKELTSSLQLKETELEQVQEEKELIALQLEIDTENQKQIHEDMENLKQAHIEEMEKLKQAHLEEIEKFKQTQLVEHKEEMAKMIAEKNLQAQRERACQTASVTLFQNMVGKLQTELSDTQEKLRDTTHCWSNTKEQLQKCEQAYRRSKKDLVETSQNLHEVEQTVMKLGDAIGMLETEKETNMALVRALEERDREMRDMEYRLRVLEEERE